MQSEERNTTRTQKLEAFATELPLTPSRRLAVSRNTGKHRKKVRALRQAIEEAALAQCRKTTVLGKGKEEADRHHGNKD
jgi:hypothetical protein